MKFIREQIEDVNYLIEDVGGKKNYFIEGVFCQAEQKNRNGRVYPYSVLDREVSRYNKEYVGQNRAFGELGHPDCFHPGTEILTENGWKQINKTLVGENVYSLSLSGKVELVPVLKTFNESYKGNMISLECRGMKTKVTPNHRFVLYNSYTQSQIFVTAQELYDNRENLRSKWRDFFIPKKFLSSIERNIETYQVGKNTIDLKLFSEFFAWYLAEGWTSKRKDRKNSYIVALCQNEGEKADILREILKKLPWNFSEYKRRNGKNIIWKCHNQELANYLFPLGKSYEKYIPKDFILSLSTEHAEAFIDSYILGDGRGKRNKKYFKSDVFSTSERLIDDICHIASIAGIATRNHKKIAEKDSSIGDRVIKKENKRPLYFCQMLTTKGIYMDSRQLSIDVDSEYDSTVHCVTVKNGTFFARDSGYTFWTGNSPSINLDRVSHMITKLYPDGNNFIGKAKIMDTPMGNIAKGLLDGGAKLGVSTRGVGSLKPVNGYQLVQDDFKLAVGADIVADPSAPDAFVSGIMENYDWWYDSASGIWQKKYIEESRKKIKTISKKQIEEKAIQLLEGYLKSF